MTDSEKKPNWSTFSSKLHKIGEEFETAKSRNQTLFIGLGRPYRVSRLVKKGENSYVSDINTFLENYVLAGISQILTDTGWEKMTFSPTKGKSISTSKEDRSYQYTKIRIWNRKKLCCERYHWWQSGMTDNTTVAGWSSCNSWVTVEKFKQHAWQKSARFWITRWKWSALH